MFYQIAIDGFSGAGKSTVSKLLAKRLNFININTGLFFRALTYCWLKTNEHNWDKLIDTLNENKELTFKKNNAYFKNKKINKYLFDEVITKNICRIAEESCIRDYVLSEEKKIASKNNVVMEGRDIGSVIFPDAILKIYLTANLDIRAKRRYEQFKKMCPKHAHNFENIKKDLERRDFLDTNRKNSPLKKCDDAIEINTDFLTAAEIVEQIYNLFIARTNFKVTAHSQEEEL